MHNWAKDLFPFCRSITGSDVRKTLKYLQGIVPEIEIREVPSGTEAFDWIVPNEWSVRDAFISDISGNKIVSFRENNLHLMGYSTPVDRVLTRSQLEDHLHSIPSQPDAIPYVTSYYKENWGFCLSENQRVLLGEGPFRVLIDSTLEPGSMTYGEAILPGETQNEILLSTYICHPSMANNELSGPVVATALLRWLKLQSHRRFTYRVIFIPETIGSIYYLSRHLNELKTNVKAGWVLTCIGDERNYSYVPTRFGNTFTDRISKKILEDRAFPYTLYSFLDRGSDERQFCFPGIDLPIGSLMRSKYQEFPEYHTSFDNLDFVTPLGLLGGFEMLRGAISIAEANRFMKTTTLCEPQLSKRNLYPDTSFRNSSLGVKDQMNVLTYCDGDHDLLEIAKICDLKFQDVETIVSTLENAGLVEEILDRAASGI